MWVLVSTAARIWDPIGRLLSIHRHRGCLEADMRRELRVVAISLDGVALSKELEDALGSQRRYKNSR